MKLDKENTKQIIKIIIVAVILIAIALNIGTVWNGIKLFLDILSPFIWGLAIAFILNIFMIFYENKVFFSKKHKHSNSKEKTNVKVEAKRKSRKRTLCIFLSIITIVAIIAIIMVLIVPELYDVIKDLISNIPSYLEDLKDFAIDTTQRVPEVNTFIQNINIDTNALKEGIMNLSKNVLDVTINQVTGLFSNIVNFFIAVIFAIYILANKEQLKIQAKKFIYANFNKEKAGNIIKISRLSRDSFRNFITGQAKEAVILGTLCAIGMFILGIPYALPVGALTALTAFIPIVGAFIGGFVGAILIVVVNPIKALIFVIFIIVLQQIEGNLIYPHVVGKNMGLPGIWVLVAITIGGSLFGIIGMIVGLPIIAVIYSIVSENIDKKLKEKNIEKI